MDLTQGTFLNEGMLQNSSAFEMIKFNIKIKSVDRNGIITI